MMANDIGDGFLAMVAIGVAFMVVADRFGRVRLVAILGAWIGAVAAVAGVAVALCAVDFPG